MTDESGVIDQSMYERWCRRGALEKEWDENRHDLIKRWALLRRIYAEYGSDILEAHRLNPRQPTDPYFVDWLPVFTEIEYDAWCSIRYKGLPFYPQVPARQFFIDFANPCLKIGVELDGRQWHDEAKDRRRDTRLLEDGWKIFRISGAECYQEGDLDLDYNLYLDDKEEEREQRAIWLLGNSSHGIFESIKIVYFDRDDWRRDRYFDHAVRALVKHRLVDFPIGELLV